MLKWMSSLGLTFRISFVSFATLVFLGALLTMIVSREVGSLMLDQAVARQRTDVASLRLILEQHGAFQLQDGKLVAGSMKLADQNELLDRFTTDTGGVATIFQGDVRIATNVKKPDGSRGIGTNLAKGVVYQTVFESKKMYAGPATVLERPYVTAYDPIFGEDGKVIGILFVGLPESSFRTDLYSIIMMLYVTAAGVTLVLACLQTWIVRRQMKVLSGVQNAIYRLSENDLTVDVPGSERSDEIGRMAKAVIGFKDNAARVDEMTRREEVRRRESEQERRQGLLEMARKVESESRSAVNSVIGQSEAMADEADRMALSAAAVADSCRAAAAAAEMSESNSQAVAAAAEQLSASIHEIAGQIGKSGQIIRDTTGAVDRSQEVIGRLSTAVGEISQIAALINDIASQTNLLALNATIEAARAGDAGKGFAVVANEVKHLANQTARATDDINNRIAQIQATTGEAVRSVSAIAAVVSDVEEMSTALASGVEEQSAATAEIARSVNNMSHSAHDVAKQISIVADEALATGRRADQVKQGTDKVKGGVEDFANNLISLVNASTH